MNSHSTSCPLHSAGSAACICSSDLLSPTIDTAASHVGRSRFVIHMSEEIQYTSAENIDDRLTSTSTLHTDKRVHQFKVLRTMVNMILNRPYYIYIRSCISQQFLLDRH